MTKRRKQKYLTSPNRSTYANRFDDGSWMKQFKDEIDNVFGTGEGQGLSGANVAGMLKGAAGAIGSAVGKGIGNTIAGKNKSAIGNGIQNLGGTVGGFIGKANPLAGAAVSAASGLIGGGVNALIGNSLNEENIANINAETAALNNLKMNADDYDTAAQNIANITALKSFNKDDVGTDGVFSNKAENEYQELLAERQAVEQFKDRSIVNNLSNIAEAQNLGLQASYAAFGGSLNTNGTDFDLGYTYINNGGSHEMNPHEGVQMGVDPQGIPNLVEEGEYVLNGKNVKDYVLSNRLLVPENMKNKYKLGGKKKDISFAEAFKKMTKESDERPNDPISQRDLNLFMEEFASTQEQVRQEKQQREIQEAIANMSLEEQQMLLSQMQGGQDPNMGIPQESIGQDVGISQEEYAYGGKVNKFGEDGQMVTKDNISIPMLGTEDNGLIPKIGTYESMTPDIDNRKYQYNLNDLTTPELKDVVNYGNPIHQPWTNILPPYKNTTSNSDIKNSSGSRYPTWMRYAPVAGAAIGLMHDLASKPNYDTAKKMEEIARKAGDYDHVAFSPLGDYLTYNPFDRQYALNQLNASAGANRRAIVNNAGGNRGSAMANILAADNNYMNQTGNLFRQAEEFNRNQEQQVASFNKTTNQYNSEGFLKADMANQQARAQAQNLSSSLYSKALELRDNIDGRREASISANLTNLFDSLGDIGRENYSRNDLDALIESGYFGVPSFKPQGWSNKKWETFKKNQAERVKEARALTQKSETEKRAENDRKIKDEKAAKVREDRATKALNDATSRIKALETELATLKEKQSKK